MIEVKHLTKSFGQQVAVDDLSFNLQRGEILAFLGANGSGKTTTIRSILNIYNPDKGSITIDGIDNKKVEPKKYGYLPEERGIYTKVSVYRLLQYLLELRDIDNAESLIEEYLHRFDLYQHRDKKANELSSGMQQKIQIATAVLHKPKILILDEPFKGLDAVNRQLFSSYFKELNEEHKSSILYSTHIVDEAQKISDKVLIIKDGKKREYGTVEDVRNNYSEKTIKIELENKLPKKELLEMDLEIIQDGKNIEIKFDSHKETRTILRKFIDNGINIVNYSIQKPSLNKIFIDLQK
jgi:ABC-2 type transport system ATP-binding protein